MKIGLALSGGVARGAAHIGVLSVLEEENIPVHCIAGTSVGAIIGAAFSTGMPLEEIKAFASAMRWRHLVRLSLSRRGLLSFAPLEKKVVSIIGETTIEALSLPFAAVATDMLTGKAHVFRTGPVATAVRVSSSIPGVIAPYEHNGLLLSDGGLSNNMPVNVARELGAEYVIGVDLLAPSDARRGVFDFSATAIEILVRHAGGGLHEADCLISPSLAGQSYVRFSKSELFFQLGQRAARDAVAKIREDIGGDAGIE